MKVRGNLFRKSIFWLHLACGLLAGAVITIMSVTGIAIAFEEEILEWVDRDVSHVTIPQDGLKLSIHEMLSTLAEQRPDFEPNYVNIPSAPERAYGFHFGRSEPVYVNPYTAEVADSNRKGAHDIIHTLEEWHRFLGMKEGHLPIGRFITGVSNLAFLVLCISGLYLWFPRQWGARSLKSILLLKRGAKGKARDYNWHNTLGFWSMPILTILAATAVVISFEWGHKLAFAVVGEEAPKSRNFGMMAMEPAVVPDSDTKIERLGYEDILGPTRLRYPNWERIGMPLSAQVDTSETVAPLKLDVFLPDYMPSRSWVPVEAHPFNGTILQAVHFQDRSLGLRTRLWMRFLHTGGAFGLIGKIVATLATAVSLVLVYSGFALSYRRFFRKKRR
ncbi:MAG: putative iron-regulated membrane protein [Lentimonas sp.]|jgi:uncharacterized iron-regulated membrane protein